MFVLIKMLFNTNVYISVLVELNLNSTEIDSFKILEKKCNKKKKLTKQPPPKKTPQKLKQKDKTVQTHRRSSICFNSINVIMYQIPHS